MNADVAKQRHYLETQIRTASPEQLLIMLFEGAIRFAEQAKVRLDGRDYEGSHGLLVRSQHIVLEVMYSLDKGIGDEVYRNLVALYRFVYLRLVRANITRDKAPVDEALRILQHLRETWVAAIDKAGDELRRGAAQAAARPQGGLSIQG
ncbi:MAG: flagellar export chaperone FliS [Planctomycetes bacterium]|nr:flagellar export chaperone FliS [Planctomycetota bacterium]